MRQLGRRPLRSSKRDNLDSCLNTSDGEGQTSHVKLEKCPTSTLNKFRKHESVNIIRLKQTAKFKAMEKLQNKNTTEAIQRAEKDFSLNLRLLLDETVREVKILNAISAIATDRVESSFYPDRPHRNHSPTDSAYYFTLTKL